MGKGRFVNPHVQDIRRTLWDAILWKLGYYDDPHPSLSPPSDFIYPASPHQFLQGKPSAVWIGHSTYLLQLDGLAILTDPVWEPYCAPFPIRALKRYSEPPIALADLPPIDLVLLSHNHYDHLDAKTVKALHQFHPDVHWILPERLSPWFRRRGITSITELPRWKNCQVKNCKITAVPAQHFSGRTFWDKNKTHWSGYLLETPSRKIYFTGDTGYNPIDFKEIGNCFGGVDLSLIPIGTYVPKRFMQPVHISPYEAVQIHQDVRSHLSLGMHWNTFDLSDEPHNRPPYDLYLAMQQKQLPFESFLPIDVGTYVNF